MKVYTVRALLILCVAAPSPVYALRPTNAGMEESKVRSELDGRFRSSGPEKSPGTGLEEVRVEFPSTWPPDPISERLMGALEKLGDVSEVERKRMERVLREIIQNANHHGYVDKDKNPYQPGFTTTLTLTRSADPAQIVAVLQDEIALSQAAHSLPVKPFLLTDLTPPPTEDVTVVQEQAEKRVEERAGGALQISGMGSWIIQGSVQAGHLLPIRWEEIAWDPKLGNRYVLRFPIAPAADPSARPAAGLEEAAFLEREKRLAQRVTEGRWSILRLASGAGLEEKPRPAGRQQDELKREENRGIEEEAKKYRVEAFKAMLEQRMPRVTPRLPDPRVWERLRQEGNDAEKATQILRPFVEPQGGWRGMGYRVLGWFADLEVYLKERMRLIAEDVAWFQGHLDTSAPSFRLEKWAEAIIVDEEMPIPYSGPQEFLERLIWPVEPAFRPLPPQAMRGDSAEERENFLVDEYLAQVMERVLAPKGIMVVYRQGKNFLFPILGRPQEVNTPAGRRVPFYLLKASPGVKTPTGGASARYILSFDRTEERFRAEYPLYRRDWENIQDLLRKGGGVLKSTLPSAEDLEEVKGFLMTRIGAMALGRHSEEEALRRYEDVVLTEEKVHSDTLVFGDALVGHDMRNAFPEENEDKWVMTKAIVREGGAQARRLMAVAGDPIRKREEVARDVREVEAWLGSLRDAEEPAFRFLFILAPERFFGPDSQAIRTGQAVRERLRQVLFPGIHQEVPWTWEVMRAVLDYQSFNQLLRDAANEILKEDFLTLQEREEICPQPWTPYAGGPATSLGAGLEEAGEATITVPVADHPAVRQLFHHPEMELRAGLGRMGLVIQELPGPEESRAILREGAGPNDVVVLVPQAEPGEWLAAGLESAVLVMPAHVAAGLEEREWAALLAAARASGGSLRIREITRTGLEEQQALVLHMA